MIIRTDLISLATSKRYLISLITSLLKCTQKVSSELRLSRKTKQQRLHICRNDFVGALRCVCLFLLRWSGCYVAYGNAV